MKPPLLSACLRSFGRPLRTRRMLDCIAKQTMTNWELLFMGDGCNVFKQITQSQYFKDFNAEMRSKGNSIYFFNAINNHADWGAYITNMAIKLATGKNFLFLDNDDQIRPEHFQFYTNSIEGIRHFDKPVDFVYNKTAVHNGGNPWVMDPELKEGSVGHGSLIVNTKFLQQMPKHENKYGQDWTLIQHMMKDGIAAKGTTPFPTYHVMSLPNMPEPGFENDH